MGTYVTNCNNKLFPTMLLGHYKSKALTKMEPVIGNENVTLTQIPEPSSLGTDRPVVLFTVITATISRVRDT